ncbi:Bifunctional protein GlmU [Dirofilaria immitis]
MSQKQILHEPPSSSSLLSSYFDDHHHYRFLRTFTPTPYRSSFHTCAISLPDIKEATTEENDSSCSSNSLEHNNKADSFHDRNIRRTPEQNLNLQCSNNLITIVDHQEEIKKNAGITSEYQHEQLDVSWPSDTCKSSRIQTLYPSESTDIIYSNKTSCCIEKDQKSPSSPPISIITLQIMHPTSHHRTVRTKQNDSDCNSKSKTVYEVDSNFSYPSDLAVPSQNPFDASESSRNYSSDSNKQPKSILKQRSISSYTINDDNIGRYVERVQINDSSHKESKQQYHEQSYDSSDRTSQPSHSSNPSLDSIGRENKLYHIMQENLRQQNLRPQTPRHLPQASFNGPFFTLEEVHCGQQRESVERRQVPLEECCVRSDHQLTRRQQQNPADDSSHKSWHGNRSKSASVMEMHKMESEKNNEIEESIVHWSSPSSKQKRERARSVPPSLKIRNITDPDRIDEYHRQKELELEAMRRKKEAMLWGKKQLYYKQMQAKCGIISPELGESMTQSHEELQQIDMNAQKRQKEFYFEESFEPKSMRIYETRPIMVTSEESEEEQKQQESIAPTNPMTWKRLYIVDHSKPTAKNEIITSEQLLEKERFDIDLLKRREAFIEKPKPEPVIYRTGKRWKPPPEQSYIWPHERKILNTEPSFESSSNYSTDNTASRVVENAEFRWQPVVHFPEYKQESKSFTPENLLPDTPRGLGPGSLDEPAKRQIKYLIQPSSDGSHRPKPAFGGPRITPSGGFYPNAPNAIKASQLFLNVFLTPNSSSKLS